MNRDSKKSYLSPSRVLLFVTLFAFVAAAPVFAQGVTTSSISGLVADATGQPLPGVTVTATHQPSGTTYVAFTRADGRFDVPNMRVGGPYKVEASLSGFAVSTQEGVFLNLGIASDLSFTLQPVTVEGTVVTVEGDSSVFSSSRTGAATTVSAEAFAALPTVSRRLNEFVRLTSTTSRWTGPTSTSPSVWPTRRATARASRPFRSTRSKPCR